MTDDDEPLTEEEYRQVVMSFVRAIADEEYAGLGKRAADHLRDKAREIIELRWTVRS